jgi:hypothetical protein
MKTLETSVDGILEKVRVAAEQRNVFERVDVVPGAIRCAAKGSGAEAWYVLEQSGSRCVVSLITPDRWLSESIEADLMHYGDPLEELIEEELVELGWTGAAPQVKHYRSDDRLYTFISEIPLSADVSTHAQTATTWLLAYEAAFRELGDMTADAEE